MSPSPPARRSSTGRAPGARVSSERQAPGAKLSCTAGPKAGEEFLLVDEEVVIGRAVECEISIPDTSVSRRHVVIRQVEGEWIAIDQGSGNGTLINDAEVRGEHVLRNGDRITLGDTELTFALVADPTRIDVTPSNPPPRRSGDQQALARRSEERTLDAAPDRPTLRPRPSRMRARASARSPARLRRLAILVLGVLVLGLLVAGLWNRRIQQERERIALAEELKRRELEQVMLVFQEGKNLVRQGRWKQAQQKFLEVQKLSPVYPGLKEYLDRAPKEVANEVQLELAVQAVESDNLMLAAEALGKITPDTTLEARVVALKVAMQQKAEARLEAARTAQIANDHAAVVQITDDVLAAYPEHRDAKVLNEQSRAILEKRERPAPIVAGPAPKPWQPAVSLFRQGDVPGSIAMLTTCSEKKIARCGTLLAKVREFDEMYKKLETMSEKDLAKLLTLDEQITDGESSKMAKLAGARASGIFYKSAAAANAAGQWGKAVDMARKTLRADPNHAGAQAIVQELKTKAKDVYLQGYTLKDASPEEAIEKFREVLQMTSPDDEAYQKSKRWLETLSK